MHNQPPSLPATRYSFNVVSVKVSNQQEMACLCWIQVGNWTSSDLYSVLSTLWQREDNLLEKQMWSWSFPAVIIYWGQQGGWIIIPEDRVWHDLFALFWTGFVGPYCCLGWPWYLYQGPIQLVSMVVATPSFALVAKMKCLAKFYNFGSSNESATKFVILYV